MSARPTKSEILLVRMLCARNTAKWPNYSSARIVRRLPVLRSQDNAFIEAAAWGNKDLVERLLKKGTNVDATDTKYRNTALHWAAYRSHLDVVKLLVNVGANVDARNKFGSTPLFWAARRGSTEIGQILVGSRSRC